MPIVFRAAMKPTPSIYLEQDSVDMVTMKPVKLSIKGRHDPCVVVRALPVFEAAAAIALSDILLDN
jgi:chorismate synthase